MWALVACVMPPQPAALAPLPVATDAMVAGAVADVLVPPVRPWPSAPQTGAALWGFVDGHGVAHFAARPLDVRYQLVMAPDQRVNDLRVPGKTDSAARLLTWLDIAPAAKAVQPWLREAGLQHGVDPELLKALIAVESGFNSQAVSPRGALGLMQITPDSAQRYGTPRERLLPPEQRMLDARTNIHTGARMLADLLKRHSRIDVALAAWNAGEGTVRRHGGELPPIDETRAHVHMVVELYWALLQRSQHAKARQMRVQAASADPA